MGLFRKTKKPPQTKKVEVKSFGKGVNTFLGADFGYKAGDVIPFKGRQMGKSNIIFDEFGDWDGEALKKLMKEMPMPRVEEFKFGEMPEKHEWMPHVTEAKLTFAVEMLHHKHKGINITVNNNTPGDYIELMIIGRNNFYKINRTQLEIIDAGKLANEIEYGLGLVPNKLGKGLEPPKKPKSSTESWADEWAKKQKS